VGQPPVGKGDGRVLNEATQILLAFRDLIHPLYAD
jgi:hypothetical protein